MQIGGIAWWVLVGTFGFGAGVGAIITLVLARRLFKSDPSDWWGPLIQIFFGAIGMIVIPPIAGIAAIALTFGAHHYGWDGPLPYLAGIGLVFLTCVICWILWLQWKPSPSQKNAR